MKKYLLFIAFALFLASCGSKTNENKSENDVNTQEEEIIVEKGNAMIDSSVNGVKLEVEKTENEVNDLLKGI